MALEHFSHDHPLILRTDYMEEGVKVHCYGCRQPISGLSYGCTKCEFFLHKSCAELPREMTYHPAHPEHPLTLLSKPPYSCTCDVCREDCNRFVYNCFQCKFDVDIRCALVVSNIQQRIELKCHPHQLIPLEKSATFFCDACGEEHGGTSYLCTTCGFWVSQKCANSLPSTIKLEIGDCEVETEHKITLNSGRATSNIELSKDCDAEIEVENRITLPADESVDLRTLFVNHIKVVGKCKEATEIRHFSHEHTLYFSNKQIDQESHSESNSPLLNEVENEEKCNACSRRISGPFYHCVQCNFLLHEYCAELPSTLHHPCHPQHTLCLTTNFQPNVCQCCSIWCNLFKFGCSECEFFLDIGCASLPRTIRHEAHNHTLALRPTGFGCNACDDRAGFGFLCETCNFNVCQRCVLMTRTVRHRYDEHPFILTYSPVKDQTNDNEEYICEICEEDIDPKYWFYYCGGCDQSLHMNCIRPSDRYSNVKYGITFNFEGHPHLLTLVRTRKDINSLCAYCKAGFVDSSTAYECAPCNFWIHLY
ncbi:unnamed protein product [Camellia sinensis]